MARNDVGGVSSRQGMQRNELLGVVKLMSGASGEAAPETNSDPGGVEFDPVAHRENWLRRMADEFSKLEAAMPMENFLPETEGPPWVQNLEREVRAAMFPVAKLKEGLDLTPRRLGAILGHQCAVAVWMMDWLAMELNSHQEETDQKTTPEQMDQIDAGREFIIKLHDDWYCALRRLAKRALATCVDQTYEVMRDFLRAYADGFARKPTSHTYGSFGNSSFEVYVFMLWHWQLVAKLNSVRELHDLLVKNLGSQRAGDLKRTEKICQRICLHYRKPGRPKGTA